MNIDQYIGESDAEYLHRLVHFDSKGLSEGKIGLLTAKINYLTPIVNAKVVKEKKRKSVEEAERVRRECPNFFDETMEVSQQLQSTTELHMKALTELLAVKSQLHAIELERAVYLKAALKMFQRGIVELELQTFLQLHTARSKNNKQFLCGSVWYNCDFSTLMRHWRSCSLHPQSPTIIDRKQVDARLFKSTLQNVETAVDHLYSSLSTTQHFRTDYPIKLTPFTEDSDTLALVSFLEFYKVDYCLLCDEQGKVDA